MTRTQKFIIEKLFEGYTIAAMGKSGNRLRDQQTNVIRKINARTFRKLRSDILDKNEEGLFVISNTKTGKFHGNSLIKKLYNKNKKNGNI